MDDDSIDDCIDEHTDEMGTDEWWARANEIRVHYMIKDIISTTYSTDVVGLNVLAERGHTLSLSISERDQ